MSVTKDQAQMLTALAIACRPNGARRWDSAGVMAALKHVADRSLPEVIMATITAASDRDVDSPGVIPTGGSHWTRAAVTVRTGETEDRTATRCTVCGRTTVRHGYDHDFTPPRPRLDTATVAAHVAALKAELAPTSGPTERRTLEDLAAANPVLHARVEAVRAAMPTPEPMREDNPRESDVSEEPA